MNVKNNEYIKELVRKALKKHIDLKRYRVFFFGSRVKNTHLERSDIDIGIKGDRPLSAKKFFEIKEELDNLPVFYEIDLVDFSNVSDKFKREALKNIELI